MSFPKVEGYVFTEKLGSGSYSTVYKAYTKIGARTIVAIKCIDKSSVKHSGVAVDNLITEIRLMKSLSHPHIVHMKEFTWDTKNIYIIMEYCCGGDLSKYIQRYGRVPEKQVLYFLQQLASALKFLREKDVAHMDLKPHNLLLHKRSDGKYLLKVGDFGFAQHLTSERMRCIRGSPLYMAPEMIAGDYDARVDLWSTGVIMYECLFGRAPYASNTLHELMKKIQRKDPIQIPPNSSISQGCCDLLIRLLQHDPNKRISYVEFFNHEYLDLEHMPSKENYDKAVCLIKQAIELDCAGSLEPALRCYSEGLQYLVPVVHVETDSMRRTALTAKLTRYMERAEEIMRYVKSQQQIPIVSRSEALPPVIGRSACCVGAASGNTYDFNGVDGATNSNLENGVQESDKCQNEPISEDKKIKTEKSRFARFFGRPVPYLDRENSADETKKTDKVEDNADMCKIT
ncbi:serine/threonine-protein kinase ULK3 [Pieris brassicae]|uniref:serine/threonine-protein kinase ULK3 n=1 Tax=Pieris brassicae TaxID=7116 RepID=UPI001E661A3F|nr:serine/threonine-protein kinase ULK3 [Pieris brassicae]